MGLRSMPLVALAIWLPTAAAYESDQLTDREVPLADATAIADTLMDAFLAEAVARANRKTRCRSDLDRSRAVLARAIKRTTSRMKLYPERGALRALGFDRYSVALERSPADRRTFSGRDDLWGDLHAWQGLILAVAGPCSTFRIGDQLIGTDKLEHFLATGETYHRWSRGGVDPEGALRKGTRRERTWDGPWSSRVFSYADLAANADGFSFYAGLLGPGSTFAMEEGCIVQQRPWSWAEWIRPAWDEALDPPVFNRRIQAAVDRRIAREPERYCRAWEALGGPAWSDAVEALPSDVPWARGDTPQRGDPFHLREMCGG